MLDAVTETIAHFIGVFSIQLERARMREDHERFVADERAENDFAPIISVSVIAKAPFDLQGAEAEVNYAHHWGTFAPTWPRLELAPAPFAPDMPVPALFAPAQPPLAPFFIAPPLAVGGYGITVVPPGSVAAVIQQHTVLTDHDMFRTTDAAQPVSFAVLEQRLEALAERAEAMMPLDPMAPPESETDAVAKIEAVAASLKAMQDEVEAAQPVGFEADATGAGTFFGAQAAGLHVNAEMADTPPEMTPPARREADEVDPEAGEDGPSIAVGGNEAINHAVLVDNWSDAPLIAALGDAIELDVVMQTNVWCDEDSEAFAGPSAPGGAAGGATMGFNVALIETLANPAVAPPAEGASAAMPETWAITRLEGNLISVNWLQQVNRMEDGDFVSTEASGTQVTLELGGNLQVNFASLVEIGLQYDLILVSGSVVSLDMVEQRNVMLDDDIFVSDGDGNAGATGSGNLLWNEAIIRTVGTTSFEGLPPPYAETIEAIGEGGEMLSPTILGDPALAGLEGLRVLYIEGDLIDLDYVQQINIVGDADQLLLGAGEDSGPDIEVDAGSNLALNNAVIIDFGVDTTVYAGGEIYSDALLYQANLIATPEAAENGVMSAAPETLASEAVLFLADDMLSEPEEATPTIAATAGETTSLDVMQSMTA